MLTIWREKNPASEAVVLAAVLLLAVYAACNWVDESWEVAVISASFIALFFLMATALKENIQRRKRDSRIRYLKQKYANASVVNAILKAEYWHGQTTEELVDALGTPHAVDYKMAAADTVETWIYHGQRNNPMALNIVIENGKVTTWSTGSAE